MTTVVVGARAPQTSTSTTATAPLGLLDGDQMTVTGRYTISLAQPITSPNRDQ
jgi:hypothetical protein